MISGKTENGTTSLRLKGEFKELCADTLCIVRGVYNAIRQESEEFGERFEEIVRDHIDTAFERTDDHETKSCKHFDKDAEDLKRILEAIKKITGDSDED